MKARSLGFVSATAVLLSVLAVPAAASPILWYNGDFNGVNGLYNGLNTLVSDSRVYDDFIVPAGQTWLIDEVFSNNQTNFRPDTAAWQIRSGVSAGNGGTLVASGTGAATVTPTGNTPFGLTEIHVSVAGLSVLLTPGTYWLMVTPVDNGAGLSYLSTTSGLNAIGSPAGNDANAFMDSLFFGQNFTLSTVVADTAIDFSMGVAGAVNPTVPEPGTLALLATGAIAVRRRLRRKASEAR
jgi:hypothetical protein